MTPAPHPAGERIPGIPASSGPSLGGQSTCRRDFAIEDLHKLAFLGRARSLGFSIDECRTLLSLYDDRERSSSDVKAIAQKHLARIDRKISELQALSATLHDLVVRCHGDNRPDCPIMDDLARAGTALSASGRSTNRACAALEIRSTEG
ncbi:MAG: MerR family DNA-binding protein [Citromicrobium sp.]|nr:MerR family DNA-binding protein [Citromicrobium sp.]